MQSVRPAAYLRAFATRHLAAAALVAGAFSAALAQTPTTTIVPVKPGSLPRLAPSQSIYAGESSYFEKFDRTYTFNADGTGTREISGIIHVQSQSGVRDLSVLSLAFASSSEHPDIDYVRVRRPDGALTQTPAADAQEQPAPVTREAPFYSDLKSVQIPVRGLRPGDTLEYHIRFVRTRAEAPNQFWGSENFLLPSSGAVALAETITLRAPESTYVQVWSPGHNPDIAVANGLRSWTWHSAQLTPVAGKQKGDLLVADNFPDLGTNDKPRLPAIAWTTFHSWAEVGAWYRSLEASRIQPDDDVKARVDQLIQGKSTPLDKAKAIYGFVGPQIRYIGVAFGVGRFQPHEAGDILRNQYGDCKDKHTLLAAMLSVVGIQADAALIGAGEPFSPDVPSPVWFNHVITVAHIDGKDDWLDATAEVAPFQLLLSSIRDHPALVIPATGDAHIVTTPASQPYRPVDDFHATATLDDTGTTHAHIVMDLHSDAEVEFREAARSVSPAQWDELMQKISEAMGFSGKVSNTDFSRPDDLSQPFHIAYDYTREKSGDWENLRILPQLPPIGLSDTDDNDPPITPIELGGKHLETAHAEIKLPAGWSAELPLPIHVKSPFAAFDKTYKLDHGNLIVERRLEILEDHLPAGDWKTYHQWFKDAGLGGEPYIQLSRQSTPKKSVNNLGAGELIDQAGQLVQQKDLEGARAKLDVAKAMNDHQARLWSSYAAIDLAYGTPLKAIEDLKTEIKYHPDEGSAYRMLAAAQEQRQDHDAAIASMRKFMDLNPGDENGALMLAFLYRQKQDYTDSEAMLRKAVALNASSVPLKLELASELMHGDGPAEARPLLESIVADSRDPLELNNAAYELANHSLDLPMAEKAARKALDLLDEASSDGETGNTALQRAELLVNTWDTYGWILFQEGKFTEALPWIQVAWRNGLDQEPGWHLGQTLEKTNHPAEALAVYELAAHAKAGGSETLGPDIQARIDALKQAGHRPKSSPDAREVSFSPHEAVFAPNQSGPTTHEAATSLQAQRTYKVKRPEKLPEFWSQVEIDLTAKGTEAVRYLPGNPPAPDTTAPPAPTHPDSARPNPDHADPDPPDDMLAPLQHLNLDLGVPADSHAHLIRHGVLSCHSGPDCQLVLIPPTDALRS